MKTFLTILLSLFITLRACAQSPGYMGKRFQAGYGFYFSPCLFGSTANGSSIFGDRGNASTGELAINTMHEGFVEFAMKKKIMIGFSVRYYKSGYDNARSLNFYPPSNTTLIYSSEGYYNPRGMYTITGLNYSLYFKMYFRHFVAPYGRYFIVGPTIRTTTAKYDPNVMYMKMQNSYTGQLINYTPNLGNSGQTFTSFDIMAGFGRNRILYDRITVDYGFNINVFSMFAGLLDLEGDFGSTLNEADYLRRTAKWRSRGFNRFNAFIKIGYLF